MEISSLRKLLWVSTSRLQKCSFKLLLKQLSQASLLTFVNSRHNTVFSKSLTHSQWYLWHNKLPISLKLQFGIVYTVGFLLTLLELHSGVYSSSSIHTLWTLSKGLFSLHPFFTLSIFTLLLTSFTHMVSPQAGTDKPRIFLFCTSVPCYLSLGSQILQY